MTQPTVYTPATDFSDEEAASTAGRSTVRTAMLDAEFSALAARFAEYRLNLGILQRDDTKLRDYIVEPHTLSTAVLAMMNSAVTPRGDWVTATAYAQLDLVASGSNIYVCLVAHTSGTFATDLAAAKWMGWSFNLTADPELSAIAALSSSVDTFAYFTGSGNAALATVTSFARLLLAEVDRASMFTRIVTGGGALSDYLTLHADPVSALQPATKQYADVGRAFGQCKLVYTNATTLTLNRKNGSHILIDSAWRQIASAGVTLSNATALVEGGAPSASTLYYVYAEWSGSAVALKLSATAPATDTGNGQQIRTSDGTRALVGLVYLNGSSQFDDSATKRNVRSYYGRPRSAVEVVLSSGNVATGAAAFIEISTNLRLEFTCFDDDLVYAAGQAAVSNNTLATLSYLAVALDVATSVKRAGQGATHVTNSVQSITVASPFQTTTGRHVLMLSGGASAGVTTYEGVSGYTGLAASIG